MTSVEKTVFISYRRTNIPWAMAIYHNLTEHGYDVFFDYKTIASGDFEQIILGNIRARAHFLVVLTPSALERCDNPDDWLRREVETALDEKRNIVPLFLEGFSFGSPSISKHLTGKLANLAKYNGLNVPADYFDEAMLRLREKFLDVALDTVLHPVPKSVQVQVVAQQFAASNAPEIQKRNLNAQEWFEKGYQTDDPDEMIQCNSEAIRLEPDYADAYHNRGIARYRKGDLARAISDFNDAIRLRPDFAAAYYNRAVARRDKGDPDGAIKDHTEAIRLRPDDAMAYNNRGVARHDQGDRDGAIKDYTEAIRLKPDYFQAYYNRGLARMAEHDWDGTISDNTEVIHLRPDLAEAYFARGSAMADKGDYDSAAADLQKYLDLGGTNVVARQSLEKARKKIGK